MKIYSTYRIKIKDSAKAFIDTVEKYRQATDFFINVCLQEWDVLSQLNGVERNNAVEHITIATKLHPNPRYPFHASFYKFPSYLRRSAIAEAIGKVSSYKSNYANWKTNPKGKEPGLPRSGYIYPAMYRDNCFVRTGTYTAELKVWIRNTWDWIAVDLKKTDVDYILKHCKNRKECVPTLQKRGKNWYLDFAFKEKTELATKPVNQQIVLGVDLGINNACTCSAMISDGTVLRRYFKTFGREEDLLNHALNRISRAQRGGMKPALTKAEYAESKQRKKHLVKLTFVGGGSRKTPRLWARAKNINRHIAEMTAKAIMDFAADCHADIIVFEALDTSGKKKGGKKKRLHHWKAKAVQRIVMDKAHRIGMRVRRVCARNTSALAFDGSGKVERDSNNYSMCTFSTGKRYHCDLSASYNIAARYFIRETLREIPVRERSEILAKVPELSKRSTCTLSSLISLNAELAA